MNLQKYILIVFIFISSLTYCNDIYAQNWFEVNCGATGRIREIIFVNSSTGYLLDENYPAYSVLRTTNKGINWTLNYSGTYFNDMEFINQTTGFIYVANKTIKTTNGGVNWLEYNAMFSANTYNMLDSFIGYGVGYTSILLKTFDGGQNWVSLSNNINLYPVYGVKFFNQNTGIITGEYIVKPQTYGRILRTTNGGYNWYMAHNNTTIHPCFIKFVNNDTGFAAANRNIMITYDKGQNWLTIQVTSTFISSLDIDFINATTGFIVGFVDNTGGLGYIYKTTTGGLNWNESFSNVAKFQSVCFADSLTIFAGARSGGKLFKTTNGGLTPIINLNNSVPDKHTLSQNYPNPFNPITKIKFDVALSSKIKIVVYNSLGKEMAILVNENMNVGSYETEWNAESFSSGIYYYSLFINNNLIDTKKTVLIK
ncbi:MAG TPA: YCF48-related protein [Ignavibacteria bacterium]|nr:YCF48-related protein [Ignavibacteria bacterium]